MTRYELQSNIFKLTMKLYPNKQHEEVYKHLQNVWKKDSNYIEKYYKTLKEIVE
jgi:hypothetical protein